MVTRVWVQPRPPAPHIMDLCQLKSIRRTICLSVWVPPPPPPPRPPPSVWVPPSDLGPSVWIPPPNLGPSVGVSPPRQPKGLCRSEAESSFLTKNSRVSKKRLDNPPSGETVPIRRDDGVFKVIPLNATLPFPSRSASRPSVRSMSVPSQFRFRSASDRFSLSKVNDISEEEALLSESDATN